MFYTLTKLLSKYTIEPELSSTGEKLCPDLQQGVNTGVTVTPVPFNIRLVKRNDSN